MADLSPVARFASLLDRVEGMGRLDVEELRDLARLYRLHLARLARERERAADPEHLRLLNALCVRAHTVLHVPPAVAPRTVVASLRSALSGTRPAVVVAAGLLAAGFLVGAALGLRDPAAVHAFVPTHLGYDPGTVDALIASPDARAVFFARNAVSLADNAVFGASLFANNTRVGLLAFATGMLAGIPTVALTVYNGLLLGAFSSIFLRDLVPLGFLAWILPHGVPELTAIVLCGAGGLVLGSAVAVPGRAGRRVAIPRAATRAFALAALALPLFVLAALIESFVRESTFSTVTRLGVAALQIGVVWRLLRWTRPTTPAAPVSLAWLRELQSGTARSAR